MIVSHRSRLNAARSLNDIEQGDFVRRALGSRKVGLVEEAVNGWAWVVWAKDRRDYLPFCALRKVQPKGHDFDARRR
jgi:hypothetical protein